jgi:peptidoglycan hydrolase-like protein with peptidoglycan-binding domain
MQTKKPKPTPLSNDEVRQIMLRYFYDRNKNATSRRGKTTGAAAQISVIRKDLKASHGLSIQQVQSNLTYLLSQGWVEDQPVSKSFTTSKGGVVPAATSYFIITAAGIDKIDGPSEFTRDRFQGIRIKATGQNIITLGDGNQVDARYQQIGEALSELRNAFKTSKQIKEPEKVNLVADIDSIQDQLAKLTPNRAVIQNLWEDINRAASVAGLADLAVRVGAYLAGILS